MAWRITTWWKRSLEGLRGASRFHLCLHLFAKLHWTLWVGFCWFGGLTVIKTFCVWLAILTCWRIGESKKPGVFCVLVCVGLFFWDGLVKILHSISTSSFHVSSSWPTMLRARSAMQEKKSWFCYWVYYFFILSSILLEPFGSEAAVTSTFLDGWLLNSGNWTGFTSGTLPCAASSTRTWVNHVSPLFNN